MLRAAQHYTHAVIMSWHTTGQSSSLLSSCTVFYRQFESTSRRNFTVPFGCWLIEWESPVFIVICINTCNSNDEIPLQNSTVKLWQLI